MGHGQLRQQSQRMKKRLKDLPRNKLGTSGKFATLLLDQITFLALTICKQLGVFQVQNIMNIERGIVLKNLQPALFHFQRAIDAQLHGQLAGKRLKRSIIFTSENMFYVISSVFELIFFLSFFDDLIECVSADMVL